MQSIVRGARSIWLHVLVVLRSNRGTACVTTVSGLAGAVMLCGLASAQSGMPTEAIVHEFSNPLKGYGPAYSLVRDSAGNLYGTTDYGGAANLGVVFKLALNGQETVLHSFAGGTDGNFPSSGVILDAGGNVYGETHYGGTSNEGIVYKITPTGEESILHSFTGSPDGAYPGGGLTFDTQGNLYGTTENGGENGGTVFRLSTAGTETVLYAFKGGEDGGDPQGGLLLGSNSNLFGTTASTIFKISESGQETVLYRFTGSAEGSDSNGGLISDSAGSLYGTTSHGGAAGYGEVFQYRPSGKLSVLYSFTGGSDGTEPDSGVIRDQNGNLYGTTSYGGAQDEGVVYKVSSSGQETVLHSFSAFAPSGGETPLGGLLFGSGGNLLGTTIAGGSGNLGLVFALSSSGEETVLFSFPAVAGGFSSQANLTRDSAGNLYGFTVSGGKANGGVIFKIDSSGNETVLHSFGPPPDGDYSSAGVVLDSASDIYGITSGGGTYNLGTVFKVTPEGQETILLSFGGNLAEGADPTGIAIDAQGNIYGAAGGGDADGDGVIYKLDPTGDETVLYTFSGGMNGSDPVAVTLDSAGNLYGTTRLGGFADAGTVFEIPTSGGYRSLYSFSGGSDGGSPGSGVVVDSAGNVYGTTYYGGASGLGVVFELSGYAETVLLSFNGANGSTPNSVALDSSGSLYGTTFSGGTNGDGVVFQIPAGGGEVILHDFAGGADGNDPVGVVVAPSGALYGATADGGKLGGGVVYSLSAVN